MLYVMTLDWHPGLTREQRDGALARRAEWKYPDGVEVLGEYWLSAEAPAVLVVFRAESFAPLMDVGIAWGDVFRVTTYPAVGPDEGLAMGAAALQRRQM